MDVLEAIDRTKLPRHIAIIMDGNGRWAKERNQDRVYGHHEGVLSVRDNFWPMAVGPDVTLNFQGWVNTSLTIVMMVCVVVILANAVWKWTQVLSGRQLAGANVNA